MAKQLMDFHLRDLGVEAELVQILNTIARAGKTVGHALQTGPVSHQQSNNSSGEQQLALDVFADETFCKFLSATKLITRFASEEQEDEVVLENSDGSYAVAFDPLDGSSLVDANFAVGTIFSIFAGNKFIGLSGRDLVAAGYLLYGPRTSIVIATEHGIVQFLEDHLGEFSICEADRCPILRLFPEGKLFAPGNLRAVNENPNYKKLVNGFAESGLTLRYSGGMVPDIHMLLSKGGGIFTYPGGQQYPDGKLRLLYEVAAMAYVAERAGGIAVTETGQPILDLTITELHQRSTILVGSKSLVEQAVVTLNQ